MKKEILHPTIGSVVLSQSRRARRISLSVGPNRPVRLSFPLSVSTSEALKFLDNKQEWIVGAQKKFEKTHPNRLITPDYKTRSHGVKFMPSSEIKQPYYRIKNGTLQFFYPNEQDPLSDQMQEVVREGVVEVWRQEAKLFLPPRVEHYSKRHSLPYRSVSVRNTRSKWGSCSARNDISLSAHLMKLPNILIDYIILHELCHVAHKNHSAEFHAYLDRLTGGRHKELNKELKTHSPLPK